MTIDNQTYITKETYLKYMFHKRTYRVTVVAHNNNPQIEDAFSSFNYSIKVPLIDNGVLLGGSFDKGVVALKNNIIEIGKQAFKENLDVRELYFDGDLIGESAFESALNLSAASFERPLRLSESAFRNCVKLRSIDFRQVKEMGAFCFENCGMLETIVLREGLCCIPEKAFRRCIRVKEINFPHSLQSIGKEALRGCMGLINLQLPDGLKIIEEGALTYLTIKKIVLPKSLEAYGRNNLQNCSYLEEIGINDNDMYSVENGCLVYDKTTLLRYPPARKNSHVVIPDNILIIARDAFRDSAYLKTIVANNIQIIESGAFYGCSSLRSVILSGKVKKIGSEAFIHCPNLRDIVINSSTTLEIEHNAIADSVKLNLNNTGEENV